MITYHPPMMPEAAATVAVSPLRVLAVGSLTPDALEVRAASLIHPRQDVVEHRIAHWPGRGWVAEVRVNYVMTHRSLFSQGDGYTVALAWCNAIAPLAKAVQL